MFHCYVSLLEGKYNPNKLDNFTYYPYINPCCLASVAKNNDSLGATATNHRIIEIRPFQRQPRPLQGCPLKKSCGKWFISDSWIIFFVWEHVENPPSGQITKNIKNPKPELEDFVGDSLAKPPFRVTSDEVVVISLATVFFRVRSSRSSFKTPASFGQIAMHGCENLKIGLIERLHTRCFFFKKKFQFSFNLSWTRNSLFNFELRGVYVNG